MFATGGTLSRAGAPQRAQNLSPASMRRPQLVQNIRASLGCYSTLTQEEHVSHRAEC